MKNSLCFSFLFISLSLFAQVPTQTVRGKVFDSETNYPLYGVKIEIDAKTASPLRSVSSEDGLFEINNVPVGKYDITAIYALYATKTITIEVNSGKELIVNILSVAMVVPHSLVTDKETV